MAQESNMLPYALWAFPHRVHLLGGQVGAVRWYMKATCLRMQVHFGRLPTLSTFLAAR